MRITRSPAIPLIAVLLLLDSGQARGEQADEQHLQFFEKRIRPVLVEHCYECHAATAKAVQGGLRVDTRQGLLKGGDSGPAIVPGLPGEGTLLAALRHETFEMPPKGKLSEAILDDFARWIADGAVDPRGDAAPVSAEGDAQHQAQQFWAYQPITTPTLPAVRESDWPLTPIDHFVLNRLEQAGIAPAEDADRGVLARRLYFDLWGLPPTPAQLSAFVSDESPDAYARLVDRLLASPRFGERWGRHWLDVARFAESTGGGRTRILRNAWRYRDYVINAWNDDKPFDLFLREQIAGDLLPADDLRQAVEQLTATSFLALGPTNYELQDKVLLRMEIVDEQLDTIGRAFMGQTIGCARCHDHKFDPIPTRDYYALAGIFRSTKTVEHANVSNFIERQLPLPPAQQRAWEEHRAAIAALQQELSQIEQKLAERGASATDYRNVATLPGIVVDDRQAELIGTWSSSASVSPFVGEGYQHVRGEAEGKHRAIFRVQLPEPGRYEVRIAYAPHGNRAANAPVTVRFAGGSKVQHIDQRQTPAADPVFHSLGEFDFAADQPAEVVVANGGAAGVVIIDAVQFLPARKDEASNRPDQEAALLQNRRRSLKQELRQLEARPPVTPAQVMSVYEESAIEDCALHVRGNVRNLGPAVPRGFLSVASWDTSLQLPADESGRRELAEWMADPRHPLTSRVIANRLWQHLLGEGLVRTPDNFGSTGQPPTHPELLDYLASGILRDQWSLKNTIRQIVCSRTYQLASVAPAGAADDDPENRLLSHRPRRRLDAEAIRDAMLAVSGELDLAMFGTPVPSNLSSEFGYEFQGQRRSVYVPAFRNAIHGLFEVFDAANPNLVTGRRNQSTLPTQALYMMNSPFVMQRAEQAAHRLLREAPADPIEAAFQRALGRSPKRAERHAVEQYLAAHGGDQRLVWPLVFQTLYSCLDFRYVY